MLQEDETVGYKLLHHDCSGRRRFPGYVLLLLHVPR
jgi:hypothetical protein